MKLYAYNNGSASAKALADALGIKRIKHEGPQLRVDTILNWGASRIERAHVAANGVINRPQAITKAVNKLEAFKCLDGHVPIPEWTESVDVANKWFAEGSTVVGREKLNGHSGEGIRLFNKEICDCIEMEDGDIPLYTKYIPKKEEYRLHVFRDRVFFVQRKARHKDVPDEQVNWKVRNHGNGFIFAHIGVDVPDVAKQAAITAVQTLGLDFGAVDLIWNQKEDKYYVIEVNTACGLEGTTLDKYVEVFKEFV